MEKVTHAPPSELITIQMSFPKGESWPIAIRGVTWIIIFVSLQWLPLLISMVHAQNPESFKQNVNSPCPCTRNCSALSYFTLPLLITNTPWKQSSCALCPYGRERQGEGDITDAGGNFEWDFESHFTCSFVVNPQTARHMQSVGSAIRTWVGFLGFSGRSLEKILRKSVVLIKKPML